VNCMEASAGFQMPGPCEELAMGQRHDYCDRSGIIPER
jgi:hypothetical protein